MKKDALRIVLASFFVLSAGCDTTELPARGPAVHSTITLSLDVLHAASFEAQQSDCAIPISDAVLIVDGDEVARASVSPTDRAVVFDDVVVRAGSVRFEASILSNTSVPLYRGATTAQIDTDGFNVALGIQPAGPIMEVCSGGLRLIAPYTYSVANIGNGFLDWDVEPAPSTCRGEPCLSFYKKISDTATGSGILEVCPSFYRAGAYTISLQSASGNLSVPFLLGQTHEATSCKPDLVVSRVEQIGAPFYNAKQLIEIPVRITILNASPGHAGTFKVSAQYHTDSNSRDVVAAYTVPGHTNVWYPSTSTLLSPGEEVSFEGNVVSSSFAPDSEVTLRWTADSCSGDEFMPIYCRVDESDENNNLSEPLVVQINL